MVQYRAVVEMGKAVECSVDSGGGEMVSFAPPLQTSSSVCRRREREGGRERERGREREKSSKTLYDDHPQSKSSDIDLKLQLSGSQLQFHKDRKV